MSLNKQKKYQEENFVIKNKQNKEPIYIMTLELEKGNPERIEIYPDSNPEYLATYFCKKHNLDYNGLEYLKQKIKDILKQYIKTKENKLSSNINNNIENKENIVNNSTKINNNKSKPKINNNIKEKQYKDNKTENKYNNRIKKKIKQIENINKINNISNTISNNNIKKHNSFKNKEDKKESLEIKPQIKISPSKVIKNKRNNKYQKRNNSKLYTNKTKDNICSRILNIYENKFSFHPKINQNYKTDLTFAERQTFYKDLYIKRRKELNKFYLNKKDKNGQILFKPNLISKNFNSENKYEEEIFQKKSQIYKKYDLNKEKLTKKNNNNFQENNEVKNTKKINDKIFSENKIRAFNNLFNDLDSDQDGIISGINININKIPKNIINIIQPLLIELKEDNQTLNKDEFLIAIDKLFEDISFIEKREIINKYKNIFRKNKSLDLKNKYFRTNDNTNKLANNYYNKIMKLFDSISNKTSKTTKNSSTTKNKIEFNLGGNYKINNFDNNISDCTFNNYIKSLN